MLASPSLPRPRTVLLVVVRAPAALRVASALVVAVAAVVVPVAAVVAPPALVV